MKALSKENRFYLMGIAILAVILHHLWLRCDLAWGVQSGFLALFKDGNIGVDVFLFVSAFGCCASWEHNRGCRYFVNRIKRIWPQYILFLLLVQFFFGRETALVVKVKDALLSLSGLSVICCFGTYIEWYIPSLMVMYLFIPLMMCAQKLLRGSGGTIVLVVALVAVWRLHKLDLFYDLFVWRIPIMLSGIVAYVNRSEIEKLCKTFTITIMVALCTRQQILVNSMMIPLLILILSNVDFSKLWQFQILSWVGKHSLEIFLAQTITTQYLMYHFYWCNVWLSLFSIVAITIGLSFLFGVFQWLIDRTIYKQNVNRV